MGSYCGSIAPASIKHGRSDLLSPGARAGIPGGCTAMGSVQPTQREEAMKALAERVPPLDAGLSWWFAGPKTPLQLACALSGFWIAAAVVITGAVWWGGHLAPGSAVRAVTGVAPLMRKSVMGFSDIPHTGGCAALLWLLWGFIPAGTLCLKA